MIQLPTSTDIIEAAWPTQAEVVAFLKERPGKPENVIRGQLTFF